MLDLTWNIFSKTGNIETYLLMKEIENADSSEDLDLESGLSDIESPVS